MKRTIIAILTLGLTCTAAFAASQTIMRDQNTALEVSGEVLVPVYKTVCRPVIAPPHPFVDHAPMHQECFSEFSHNQKVGYSIEFPANQELTAKEYFLFRGSNPSRMNLFAYETDSTYRIEKSVTGFNYGFKVVLDPAGSNSSQHQM